MARSSYPPDRPLVILMGGPLHRRVYWAGELPPQAPYRDAGRFTSKPLGEIYGGACPAQLRERLPAVWEWTGTEKPSRPDRGAEGGFPRGCGYLGCGERAAYRVVGETGRPLFGCGAHWVGMRDALSVGQRVDYQVDTQPC